MIKTVGVFYVLLFSVSASPISRDANFSEKDDPMNPKYLYYQDENGTYHYEDLTADSVEVTAVKPKHVKFFLYTRASKEYEIYQMGEAVNLPYSKLYDPNKDNFFIIHGWINKHTSKLNREVKEALLEMHDLNVFVVDWRKKASQLYSISRRAVPQIGQLVGQFINEVMSTYNLPANKFKLAGHSLGAHVAGCAGAEVGGLVDYIVGMDPAGPGFTIKNTANRLDRTDAEFVQIIHTSSFLGFSKSIGHADIYPNNGNNQPGCTLQGMKICSHARAYKYFAESIISGGFNAQECGSWKDFKKGRCKQNGSTYIGTLNVDKSALGDYYLKVNKRRPYAQG